MWGHNLTTSSLVPTALGIIYNFYKSWVEEEVGRGDNGVEMVFQEKFLNREVFLVVSK